MKTSKNILLAAALLLALNASAADSGSTENPFGPAPTGDTGTATAPDASGATGGRGGRGGRGARGARGAQTAPAAPVDTSASGLVGDFVAAHLMEVLSPLEKGMTAPTAFQLRNNVPMTIHPNLPDFHTEVLQLNNDLGKAATNAPESLQAVYKQAAEVTKLLTKIGDDYKTRLTNYVEQAKPLAKDPSVMDVTPQQVGSRGGAQRIQSRRLSNGAENVATRDQQSARLSVLEDAWTKSCKRYQDQVAYAVDQLRAADRKARMALGLIPSTSKTPVAPAASGK